MVDNSTIFLNKILDCTSIIEIQDTIKSFPFVEKLQKVLLKACEEKKHNYTQFQLQLQVGGASREAFGVLLRIMEINFKLEKLI